MSPGRVRTDHLPSVGGRSIYLRDQADKCRDVPVVLRGLILTFRSILWAIVTAMSAQIHNPQIATRECGNCHAQMQQLGKLPAIQAKRALKVFRCYGCNNVEVEPQ